MNIQVTNPQFDAILAGLRLLRVSIASGAVSPDDNDIGQILTNGGEHPGLSAGDVQDLSDQLNHADHSAHDALVKALQDIIAKFESDPDDLATMDAGIAIARGALAKAGAA